MVGFETGDQATVENELLHFMPDLVTVKRRNTTYVKGDYVLGTPTTMFSNVKARIQPITPLGTEKTRLKAFPASIADRAEYLITLDNANVYKDGDMVIDAGGLEYNLLAVRFDNATWRPVVRAVAVRVE